MAQGLTRTQVGCFTLPDDDGREADAERLKKAALESALRLIDEGAGILLVTDRMQSDDTAHQHAMDALLNVCQSVDVPVIGTGEIRRMEDVKKLLYAGCDRVALDKPVLDNETLFQEVLGKFGPDRLTALIETDSAEETAARRLAEDEKTRFPLAMMAPAPGEGEKNPAFFLVSEELLPRPLTAEIAWDAFKKGPDGLVPVVVQDYKTDEVLMVAWMNEEAYLHTIETGRMTYYSRSRQEQWVKGETSGHFQYVRSLTADCDLDTILAKVKQVGAACHTGSRSCFFNGIASRETTGRSPRQVLNDVYAVIADRKVHPKEGSYTNYLFDKGIDKILKKCGEEATEIVIAAKNPNDNEIKYEIADFLYHLMVLMVEKGVTWEEITEELARR
ncbi:MAG: bifunctional phosphoribosyl-AMP cyclohydrolase/phosphoribosyl-ATP diphosphatase HisIE [Lachnospiraceae bacterium]|nr:bifunctional phosphoribosyl-AMP cyclohydrolase/phosphoribosyl-ATP diphosphatase HisIE [Lachnospiraceae bacterium]